MTTELLAASIGIGLALSLLFAEFFGITAGGMVVAGYIAVYLHQPMAVLVTILSGVSTFAIVRALSSFMLIYGRRRTLFMILIGYLIGMGINQFVPLAAMVGGYQVIGFIIPGLIAIWLDRQGVVETLAALAIVSVMVRLILMLTLGKEFTLL